MSIETNQNVVIALGNRYRGDDGVGHTVVEELVRRGAPCRVVTNQDDSMALINAWESASLAIIVDAAEPRTHAGAIHRLDLNDQPLSRDLARCSSHGLGFAEALELGTVLERLPEKILVYAVEAEQFNPGEVLSPDVLLAAEAVVELIERDLSCTKHP